MNDELIDFHLTGGVTIRAKASSMEFEDDFLTGKTEDGREFGFYQKNLLAMMEVRQCL